MVELSRIFPATAILLLSCYACVPVTPVASLAPIATLSSPELESGWEKTCYADALTQDQASQLSGSSENLEAVADKLAEIGKHNEAIRKYSEAGAAALNEAIADGRAEGMENYIGDVKGFKEENRSLVQKSAESNFKIGRSYTQVGKFEIAIDCFDGALKIGMLPPNDAIVYLNRGDTYKRMGIKDKARADLNQAATLFKKYKLPSYQKDAEKRLQELSK